MTNEEDGASDDDYSGVPESVTFNTGETSKTFTFRALQDRVDDDSEAVRLSFGELHRGVHPGANTETVANIDDDEPGVNVSPTSLTISPGGSDSYAISLNTQPSDTVVVTPASDNPGVTFSPLTFTVTPEDWNHAQTVTVSAATDSSGVTATITHTVDGYGSVTTAPGVSVTVPAMPTPVPIVTSAPTATPFAPERDLFVAPDLDPFFVEGAETRRSVLENAEPGTPAGGPVQAMDPDGGKLAYSLTGPGRDPGSFTVDEETGQIRTKVVLDYEEQNRYDVVVGVRAEDGDFDAIRVAIEVINVEPEQTPEPPPV